MSEGMIGEPRKDDKSTIADSFVSDLITEIQSKSTDSNRLHQFVMHYNKEFKKQELMNKTFFRDVSEPDILRLIKGPLTLYALNMNGQVLIDLAGILERYAIIYITELFKSFPARQDVVRKLLKRQSLDRLAKHLVILGLWDKKDKKDVVKLKERRDGVAHKNVEYVSNELNNGKPVTVLEIDLVMSWNTRKKSIDEWFKTWNTRKKSIDESFKIGERNQQIIYEIIQDQTSDNSEDDFKKEEDSSSSKR